MYQPLSSYNVHRSRIKRRGKSKHLFSIFLVLLLVAIVAFLAKFRLPSSDVGVIVVIFLVVPSWLVKECSRRLIVFLEEYSCHLDARYKKDLKAVIRCCFNEMIVVLVFAIIYSVIIVILLFSPHELNTAQEIDDYFSLLPLFLITGVILAAYDILFGCSGAFLNCVLEKTPSMAQIWANGAYTSYLKVVLETITERIKLFEKNHSLIIPLKKLVLHVPYNCDVHKTFDLYDESIKYVGDLEYIPNDQGANMNRCYKNPVYQILSKNQSLYVAMEQPSSLLTLWKLRKMIPAEIIEFQKNVFISTLQKHLEGEQCIMLVHDNKLPLAEFLMLEISRQMSETSVKLPIE